MWDIRARIKYSPTQPKGLTDCTIAGLVGEQERLQTPPHLTSDKAGLNSTMGPLKPSGVLKGAITIVEMAANLTFKGWDTLETGQ